MLTGEKVKLRELREEDIKLDHTYINDPEVILNKRSRIPYPTSLEQEKAWFEGLRKVKDTYDFAIESLEEGLYIGTCGVYDIDWHNSIADVGIMIGNKAYRGKGYGTDAMKVLLDFIFNQINVNKVQLSVFGFNERAIKSYLKCGFIEEGRIRQSIFRNGRYHDKIVMGILRDEYFTE